MGQPVSAEEFRGSVRPHHETASAMAVVQPMHGVGAEREGGSGVDVGPDEVCPTTVTDAASVGVCPVRASTMCAPRWASPEVATAPLRTGSTAWIRPGSAGSSMPIRQAGRCRVLYGRPCHRLRRGRSRSPAAPPAPGLRARPPIPSPRRWGRGAVRRAAEPADVEHTTGLLIGELAQVENLDDFWWTLRQT